MRIFVINLPNLCGNMMEDDREDQRTRTFQNLCTSQSSARRVDAMFVYLKPKNKEFWKFHNFLIQKRLEKSVYSVGLTSFQFLRNS